MLVYRDKRQPTVYMGEEYYFVGEDKFGYFTTGEKYRVIGTGAHWVKGYGEGAWMTCDDYPDTKDEDYGVFCTYDNFGKGKDFVKN